MENKKSKKDVIKNIIGAFFVFIGFFGMFSSGVLSGILMMLFGISLLPIVYEKTSLNKYKHIQIILPIALIILFAISLPKTTTQTNSNLNITEENDIKEEIIQVSTLIFNESSIEADIKDTKDITLEIMPENAKKEDLELCSTNTEIALIEKSEDENDDNNKINLIIKPVAEGNCDVFVKSSNGIESNKVTIKIIDNERIQKEAEEQAQKEAEQKKIEDEKAKQEESSKKSQSTTTTQSSSQSSTTDTSRTVYRTPTGKRYHYDPDCGGKNSYSTTLDSAKSAGLTPCQKCAK